MEFLYVDHERLQSYAEQTGRRSRRVLSYSGTFGLSGPSVGATSTRPELSKVHEQLDAIRKYLTREKLIGSQRPAAGDIFSREGEVIFREETLQLQSVYVPPTGDHPLLKNGLSLWISDPPEVQERGPGLLLLMEQFPLPDQPSVRNISGYTLLSLLDDEFRFVRLPNEFDLPGDFELYVPEYAEQKYAVLPDGLKVPNIPGIGGNTRQALKMLGARMGPLKSAAVLYRVRAMFMEAERDYSVTTVGYPIAIWRA